MSYNTSYSFDYNHDSVGDEFPNAFMNITGYGVDDIGYITWHDCQENMLRLSIMYPEVMFELCGEGSDGDDMWRTRYKNGKSNTVRAEIVFPEFEREFRNDIYLD